MNQAPTQDPEEADVKDEIREPLNYARQMETRRKS